MILAGFALFKGEFELLSVALALVVSLICMFGLLPLDWLADQDWTDAKVDRAIRSIMEAMALTIGFAWEQCFDASVDAIAEKTEDSPYGFINPHTTKLFLSVFCAGLLVPAWKWYILPFMVAKGWRYGYALKLADVAKVAKRMIKADEDEDTDDEENGQGVDEKKLAKVVEMLKTIHEDGRKRTKSGADLLKGVELGDSAYQALPGDDLDAVKQKNAALVEELAKAKTASLKAQQMLDTTMESMMASMKHMNQTVQRIEQTA